MILDGLSGQFATKAWCIGDRRVGREIASGTSLVTVLQGEDIDEEDTTRLTNEPPITGGKLASGVS